MHAELADKVADYLYTAPTSEFQGMPIQVTRGWQGSANLLWQVQARNQIATQNTTQSAVVKLFLDAGQARGRRQFDGQSSFAPLGIAPEPLWFDRYPQGLARQVLVYRWVEGEPLGEKLGEQPGESRPEMLEQLACAVATLHSAPAYEVRRFCPHPINLEFYWRIEGDALRHAARRLEAQSCRALHTLVNALSNLVDAQVQASLPLWESAASTPVHGDLTPENCLVQSTGAPQLVDWEMYGIGDPALDVARLLFHTRKRLATGQHACFLQVYLNRMEQPELAERIDVYRRLLSLQGLSYLINGMHQALDTRQPAQSETDATGDVTGIAENLPFIADSIRASLAQAGEDFAHPIPAHELQQAIDEWAEQIAALAQSRQP